MNKAGIKRYIHMSALGADSNGPSMYQRSKGDGEKLVMNSGLDWTIFRPSVVFGENDSFINLLAEQGNVRDEVTFLKSLIYTQTDLATINTKIQNLENLLRLYSTNQLVASPTINVTTIPGTPPSIKLDSIASNYERIYVYNASEMYNSQGAIPITLAVPTNRDFFVNFTNDDEVQLDLPNNDKLLSDVSNQNFCQLPFNSINANDKVLVRASSCFVIVPFVFIF